MRKTAFTLIEVMITIIIVAILATLAVPTYMKMAERAKRREAIATLNTIFAAERVYCTERRTYIDAAAAAEWAALNMDDPNANPQSNFGYTISGATTTTFNATATRNSGTYSGNTVTIDQTGNLGGTFNP
ncbi:MAG: type IV pilin protein [Candidatus Omnitrophota bacterium]